MPWSNGADRECIRNALASHRLFAIVFPGIGLLRHVFLSSKRRVCSMFLARWIGWSVSGLVGLSVCLSSVCRLYVVCMSIDRRVGRSVCRFQSFNLLCRQISEVHSFGLPDRPCPARQMSMRGEKGKDVATDRCMPLQRSGRTIKRPVVSRHGYYSLANLVCFFVRTTVQLLSGRWNEQISSVCVCVCVVSFTVVGTDGESRG